jgi:hypothetical protein
MTDHLPNYDREGIGTEMEQNFCGHYTLLLMACCSVGKYTWFSFT